MDGGDMTLAGDPAEPARRFEGRRVMVTGGTKGIGAACAERLAREGAEVIVTWAHDGEAAENLRRRIEAIPARALLAKADLGDGAELERVWARLGAEGLVPDLLVLNAAFQKKATVRETTPELLRRTLEANVIGCFLLATLYAAGRRAARLPGSIVIHSSNQGELVNPTGFADALSQAALNHLVRRLALAFIWDEIFDVNVKGTFLACQAVVPHMASGGGGVIVNVSSMSGLKSGMPSASAYAAGFEEWR